METTTEVKERPILFSTPMVKGVLADLKDITRRTRGLELINSNPDGFYFQSLVQHATGRFTFAPVEITSPSNDDIIEVECPYGKPGDILWVRETWARNSTGFDYKADYKAERYQWKPSIHMPRAACRLRLEIQSIRVERLHDITEEDAIREGIYKPLGSQFFQPTNGQGPWGETPVQAFKNLWESINGAESWKANPWVWRIEFKEY